MLSPRLQWLVDQMSDKARTCIQRSGITSVININAWDTSGDFITAVANAADDSVFHELAILYSASPGSYAALVRQVSRDARNSVFVPAGSHAGNAVPTRQNNVSVNTSPGIGKRRKLVASSLSEAQLHLNFLHERDRAVVEAVVGALFGSRWQRFTSRC